MKILGKKRFIEHVHVCSWLLAQITVDYDLHSHPAAVWDVVALQKGTGVTAWDAAIKVTRIVEP